MGTTILSAEKEKWLLQRGEFLGRFGQSFVRNLLQTEAGVCGVCALYEHTKRWRQYSIRRYADRDARYMRNGLQPLFYQVCIGTLNEIGERG